MILKSFRISHIKVINCGRIFIRQLSESKRYNVLFFGSDTIALNSLRKVNELRKTHNIIDRLDLVTTNNSKFKSAVEKYAEKEDIKTISWPLHTLSDAEYDIGLIVAFGHLIKQDLLSKFPLGMLNVHPSLLPRWRGAAPIIHTLLHGDEITGVTIMKIKADIFDVGEIVSQRKVMVSKHIKLPELTEHLSEIGADMLVESIKELPESLVNAYCQGEDGVTYAKKIDKSISEVKWSEMSSVQVYNLYRAIYGLYQLTTIFRDKQLKLFDAFINESDSIEYRNIPVGNLEYCDSYKALKVLCKDRKYVYFKSARILGKREIKAIDFYNGYIKNMPPDKRRCVVC